MKIKIIPILLIISILMMAIYEPVTYASDAIITVTNFVVPIPGSNV